MTTLIHPRDRSLSVVSMAIGVAAWIVAITLFVRLGGAAALAGIVVTVLILALLSFIAYVFARSAAIAHLRGNAIEVSAQQLPALQAELLACCATLAIDKPPTLFIQNGNGVLNAFATWFLGHKYVILLSSLVDALADSPNGMRFYIGHELGHVVRHDNPVQALLRWPALRLPLLGAAYSRARESTCDLHGLACSESREAAARSLSALAAGARGWTALSLDGYRHQLAGGGGFWMSFHELIASYPWTVKRVIRVLDEGADMPRRNPLAYVLALLVPYAGRMGAGIGALLYVYFIGVMAAIAIPAYQDYTVRGALTQALNESAPARDALADSYQRTRQVPPTLAAVGIEQTLAGGVELALDPKGMLLFAKSRRGTLVFTPSATPEGLVTWTCHGGDGLKPSQLPAGCR